jgi:hypothetical protein
MLNEIFSKANTRTNDVDAFVDEDYALSQKSKVNDVLHKYCTLYNKDTAVQPLNVNHLVKKENKLLHQNTTGPMWFNMKAPEITPEIKDDLRAIQLKRYIDPTQFFKKNDKDKEEKFFQIGTIQDNIVDGKHNRLKKNEVRNRIVEEIFDKDVATKYSIKKFNEIQEQRRKIGLRKSKLNKYKLQTKGKTKGVIAK